MFGALVLDCSMRDHLRRADRQRGRIPRGEPAVDILSTETTIRSGGWIEAVHSARLGRRFRVMRNRPGVDMSEPGAA